MAHPAQPDTSPRHAYLEHYPEPGGLAERLYLEHFPFRIGRSSTASFAIYSRQVSKEHAEIILSGQEYRIRDSGSTNGTFVNGQRIVEAPLNNGDIVHIANSEFRFVSAKALGASDPELSLTDPATRDLPPSMFQTSAHLKDLIAQRRVSAVFQPIVVLKSLERLGFESLGRGTSSQISANPKELFYLAEKCDLACELSRLFRETAVREAAQLPGQPYIFLNVHPAEMAHETFMSSVHEHQVNLHGKCRLVVEVHEDAVTDPVMMDRLREQFKNLGVFLAYDDFGSGQARLTELAECPPDFVKLDSKLIKSLHKAKARQEIVRALVNVCNDLKVKLIAEGVESAEEADMCSSLGCEFAQGFYFGQPQPAEQFAPPKKPDTRRVDRAQFIQRLKALQG